MTTTIQLRIDAKMKKEAQSIFEKMGLDLSSGVKLYLAQVVRDKGIPFTPRTANGFTSEYEQLLLRESKEAIRHGKRYSSAEEALRDLGIE